MRTLNEIIENNIDASVSFNSPAVLLDSMVGFAIQAVVTGTVTGTLKLQGSADYGPRSNALVDDGTYTFNWTDVDSSTEPVAGAGSVVWNFDGAFYKWVRVVFTHTANAGNMTITANAKGV